MKSILFLISGLLPYCISAQTNSFPGTIVKSEPIKGGLGSINAALLYCDGEFLYGKRIEKFKYYLDKYRLEDLTLVTSTSNQELLKETDYAFLGTYGLGENIVFISRVLDKKTKIYSFYRHTLNTESMLLGSPVLILERAVTEGSSKSMGFFKKVACTPTDENNFLALIYDNITTQITPDDTAENRFDQQVILLGRDQDIAAQSLFKIPSSDFVTMRRLLSNDGQLYILGYSQTDNLKTYRLIRFDAVKNKTEFVIIDIEDYPVASFQWTLTTSGEILLAGLTKDPNAKGGATGCVLIRINSQLKQSKLTYTALEPDFITAQWSAKQNESFEKDLAKNPSRVPGLSDFKVTEILVSETGRIFVIGEQYYEVYKSYTNSNGVVTNTTNYHYDDLLVMGYAPSGEFEWKTIVKKTQLSNSDNGECSSYFATLTSEGVNIIYTQPEAYYTDPKGDNITALKMLDHSPITTVVEITNNGEQSKYRISELDGFKNVHASFRLQDNGDIVFAQKSTSFEVQYVRMHFD